MVSEPLAPLPRSITPSRGTSEMDDIIYPSWREVLSVLYYHPGSTFEVAARLGRSQDAVNDNLRKLADRGYVLRQRRGRHSHNVITPKGINIILKEVEEAPVPPKDYMTVRIEPELRARLEKIAMQEHRSLSAQARLMLHRAVQKEEENEGRN